jgi:hypothetical protein
MLQRHPSSLHTQVDSFRPIGNKILLRRLERPEDVAL